MLKDVLELAITYTLELDNLGTFAMSEQPIVHQTQTSLDDVVHCSLLNFGVRVVSNFFPFYIYITNYLLIATKESLTFNDPSLLLFVLFSLHSI